MDFDHLRSHFPVLEGVVYLNAGTCGPLPSAARHAQEQMYDLGERDGRRMPYFERMLAFQDRQRDAYARLLHAHPQDVALTTATSEGVMRVLAGLELSQGDEIVTSDAEHPGVEGPLLQARARYGVTITRVPLAQIPEAVTSTTKLVACSHVGWVTGDVAPDLSAVGKDVPVLLDGAQGVGAIPVDVKQLGCAFYAGSGQKWLCGPVGTGMLYVAPEWQERLAPAGPSYTGYNEPYGDPDAWQLHAGARRHDTAALPGEASAAAVAAHDLLDGLGWEHVHARASSLARNLAGQLREAGRTVGPRGDTTLVSWEDPDPAATVERLAHRGVAIRNLPNTPYLRASVGAWNDESDLDRLLEALAAG